MKLRSITCYCAFSYFVLHVPNTPTVHFNSNRIKFKNLENEFPELHHQELGDQEMEFKSTIFENTGSFGGNKVLDLRLIRKKNIIKGIILDSENYFTLNFLEESSCPNSLKQSFLDIWTDKNIEISTIMAVKKTYKLFYEHKKELNSNNMFIDDQQV